MLDILISLVLSVLGSTLGGILVYFAPILIAVYRKSQGKLVVPSLGMIAMMDIFCGWTVVAWVLALIGAFGLNPIGWTMVRLGLLNPGASSGGPPPFVPQGSSSSPQSSVCGQCQGTGSMTCSSCGGRGSWYDAPQGATGSAQLKTCPACTTSGRLRCAYCGGSGQVTF